jgi:uncharacterized protein HemY
MINPATHVANFAAAWAAARNNSMQQTWDLVQYTTTVYEVNLWALLIATISFLIPTIITLILMKKYYSKWDYESFRSLYRKERIINQLSKSINEEK